ncbi:MAG: response regulator transcription factor [Verrucomicrobia bacterium]|nr:response regulator transcription factor [Verrucomicrobiota bacterium]
MKLLPRILVVDDERPMRASICQCLRAEGYRVLEASDGAQGLDMITKEKPELVVLDVMMPNLTGIEVVAAMRRLGLNTPVLMLTTRNEVPQKVEGLDAGADDYLGKPFDRRELLARVQSLLRRQTAAVTADAISVLRFGNVVVDLEKRTASNGKAVLPLTCTESALLELLAKHMGTPVARDMILDVVWGYTYFPSTRTVDTHIWRLRKKIGDNGEEPRWLKKAQGEGYVLTCDT